MQRVRARALPRVGLLGNPSDGYGGRVLAFTFEDFRAEVEASPSAAQLELAGPDGAWRGTHAGIAQALAGGELTGGAALLGAACLQREPPPAGLRLSFASDIPRQVGLAGSSAIVVACLRVLEAIAARADDPFERAEAALRAETEVLGVMAGPQDRVVQSYEGFLAMDFAPPRHAAAYRRLDPECLPPLWIAYDPSPGTSSGVSHADVRARYERGDAEVRRAIARFVELAAAGEEALARRDHARLAELLDASFDTRASIWPLTDTDRCLVRLAREHGAAAKLCGSGGAVLVLPRSAAAARVLPRAYAEAGFPCFRPRPTAVHSTPSAPP